MFEIEANPIVSLINLVFLLFLTLLAGVLYMRYFSKKPTENEIALHRILYRMFWVVFFIVAAIIMIITYVSLTTEATIKTGNDVSNWITLTVEVGIGIIIAILIMIYSRFREEKMIGEFTGTVKKSQETILTFGNDPPEENNPTHSDDISIPEPNNIGKLPDDKDLKKKEKKPTASKGIKKSQENKIFENSSLKELYLQI